MSAKQSLVLIIVITLFIRLSLLFIPAFKIDMDAWLAWAYRLNELGPSQFYSPEIWTNYTPGYLYILWILGAVNAIFSLSLENLTTLIKLVSIFFEFALAVFIWQKFTQLSSKQKLILISFLLINPAAIFNSTIWGQIDGILTFFMVLAVYYLSTLQPQKSALSYAYSFLIKPQSVALAPLFLVDLLRNPKKDHLLKVIIPGVVLFFILSLPFFLSDPILGIFKLVLQMSNDYAANSLFAYNLWGIQGFWIDDSIKFGPFTYHTLGNILYASFIGVTLYLGIKKKASYFLLASLLTLGFYFLPTRVHERYLYPAIPFLLISSLLFKSRLLLVLTNLLSLIYFLNLYYVYIYYNEGYSKLTTYIKFEALFGFLDTNGKLLSFIQSTIFIIIVWVIINIINAQKTDKPHRQ